MQRDRERQRDKESETEAEPRWQHISENKNSVSTIRTAEQKMSIGYASCYARAAQL